MPTPIEKDQEIEIVLAIQVPFFFQNKIKLFSLSFCFILLPNGHENLILLRTIAWMMKWEFRQLCIGAFLLDQQILIIVYWWMLTHAFGRNYFFTFPGFNRCYWFNCNTSTPLILNNLKYLRLSQHLFFCSDVSELPLFFTYQIEASFTFNVFAHRFRGGNGWKSNSKLKLCWQDLFFLLDKLYLMHVFANS